MNELFCEKRVTNELLGKQNLNRKFMYKNFCFIETYLDFRRKNLDLEYGFFFVFSFMVGVL